MAVLAAIPTLTPPATTPGSTPSFQVADSSYLTTPRSDSADFDALLSASHKPPFSISALKPSSPHKNNTGTGIAPRRPLCTHMTMKRIHGKVACSMCGTAPDMQYVYVCTQNDELEQIAPVPRMQPIDLPPLGNTDHFFTKMAQVAETYRMHACIVRGIRDHCYTPEQVHRLLSQKGNVFTTINSKSRLPAQADSPQILSAGPGSSLGPLENSHGMHKDGPATAEAETAVKAATDLKRAALKLCSYQACPRCRPFYVDRIYMSFETVWSGQRTALTEEEIRYLPLLDPYIAKSIGLRRRPLPDLPADGEHARSICPLYTSISSDSDRTSDLTPDSLTTSDSELDEQSSRDAYPCPGGQHCLHWNPRYGCAYDNGFDDGLRALNHGFGPEPDLTRMTPEHSSTSLYVAGGSTMETPGSAASTASSISLPTPKTPAILITPIDTEKDGESFEEVLHHRLSRVGKAASVTGERLATIDEGRGNWLSRDSKASSMSGTSIDENMSDDVFGRPLRTKPSSSTFGSEVSVKGGVALTEEAVVSASPDVADDSKDD
nr:hypothetical protein CFP56_66509 [Quercus suber]